MVFTRPFAVAAAVAAISCLCVRALPASPFDDLYDAARLMEQKVDEFGAAWNPAVDRIATDLKHEAEQIEHGAEEVVDEIAKGAKSFGEWINVFTHPAFPEYVFRYKQPQLCDPDVKQVRDVWEEKKKGEGGGCVCVRNDLKRVILFYVFPTELYDVCMWCGRSLVTDETFQSDAPFPRL